MSADLYPLAVWERFDHPRWVLPEVLPGRELARVSTPASAEYAVLYRADDGRVYWRAHAGPWLVAVLDVLCEALDNELDVDAAVELLNGLQVPPLKRYCRVMADELWQACQTD